MTSHSNDKLQVRRQRVQAGYSLLELLVVLAIMGLIAGLSVPILRGTLEFSSLARQSQAIMSTLRSLRDLAIDRQETIVLEAKEGSLSPQHAEVKGIPNTLHATWESFSRGANNASKTLTFYPDGTVSPGVVRFSYDGQTRRITVDPWLGEFHLEATK